MKYIYKLLKKITIIPCEQRRFRHQDVGMKRICSGKWLVGTNTIRLVVVCVFQIISMVAK